MPVIRSLTTHVNCAGVPEEFLGGAQTRVPRRGYHSAAPVTAVYQHQDECVQLQTADQQFVRAGR